MRISTYEHLKRSS